MVIKTGLRRPATKGKAQRAKHTLAGQGWAVTCGVQLGARSVTIPLRLSAQCMQRWLGTSCHPPAALPQQLTSTRAPTRAQPTSTERRAALVGIGGSKHTDLQLAAHAHLDTPTRGRRHECGPRSLATCVAPGRGPACALRHRLRAPPGRVPRPCRQSASLDGAQQLRRARHRERPAGQGWAVTCGVQLGAQSVTSCPFDTLGPPRGQYATSRANIS